MKRKIITVVIVVLVLIQFIPYHIVNEEVDPKMDFLAVVKPEVETTELIKDACYDCHSHYARTPWYGHIAPIKFWLNKHVRGGRMNVDFSKWVELSADEQRHALEECVEVLEKQEMPLNSYTWLHPEARLSDAQRAQLIDFFEHLSKR